MSSWRSATTSIYGRCIGIAPSAALTAAILYHEAKVETIIVREDTRLRDLSSPILLSRLVKNTKRIFFEIPVDRERELRRVTVPCGNVDFDIFVLGTNHRTLRSSQDVKKLLTLVRPDVIFVELCRDREEMLHDETYAESEYYTAAKYRRGEQVHERRKTPFLLLGDRPTCVSDLRWWEGLETVAGRIFTFFLWPFILPVRDRLWGHKILIQERDTFMAYKLQKSCAYYIEQEAETEVDDSINGPEMGTCAQIKALKTERKSSITLNSFFQETCLDFHSEVVKEPKQNPSIVAIIGSNHLDGVCALLENERVWSPEMMLQVVETERYTRNHPYTLGITNDIEEYDRGVREDSNR